MADSTTPALVTAPPDFAGRQNLISSAYNTALARLQQQQSQLYGQYGYQDGTTNLDPNNQYGSIQQLLHSTGQSLMQDDEAEAARGLSSDSGLGAQRARLINYAAGAQKNQLGQSFQNSLTGIGDQRVDATQQFNTDSLSNSNDLANYNSQMSAYQQALAAYNDMLGGATGGAVPGSTQATANTNVNPSGFNPLAPQNRGGGLVGIAKKAAGSTKPKTVIGGRGVAT